MNFSKLFSLYRISEKCSNGFGNFSAFFELWTIFWAVFRYRSGPNWVRGAWYGIFLIRLKPALRAGLINLISCTYLRLAISVVAREAGQVPRSRAVPSQAVDNSLQVKLAVRANWYTRILLIIFELIVFWVQMYINKFKFLGKNYQDSVLWVITIKKLFIIYSQSFKKAPANLYLEIRFNNVNFKKNLFHALIYFKNR